jgi:hypothetical protein
MTFVLLLVTIGNEAFARSNNNVKEKDPFQGIWISEDDNERLEFKDGICISNTYGYTYTISRNTITMIDEYGRKGLMAFELDANRIYLAENDGSGEILFNGA